MPCIWPPGELCNDYPEVVERKPGWRVLRCALSPTTPFPVTQPYPDPLFALAERPQVVALSNVGSRRYPSANGRQTRMPDAHPNADVRQVRRHGQ